MNYKYCQRVNITPEAYSACLNHAQLTDSEEVMGLLFGNVSQNSEIQIFSTICLTRNCKEKDRVEFDEIQIAKASETAEALSKKYSLKVQVVGWYHSHPKITIPPSHVDLNTQFSQQYQGPFVGLIFSVFSNEASTNINKINMIAFQTKRENSQTLAWYIPICFVNEGLMLSQMSGGKTVNITNSALNYSAILKNLLFEEHEQNSKQLLNFDRENFLNNVIHQSNRQCLMSKFIQNVSYPYKSCLNSEIENTKNYLSYLEEFNKVLERRIHSYQTMQKIEK